MDRSTKQKTNKETQTLNDTIDKLDLIHIYRTFHPKTMNAQHHSLPEKCKSKPQWGTISHQSEWLLSKSLQAISAGEGVEKREPSYTVGGNAN